MRRGGLLGLSLLAVALITIVGVVLLQTVELSSVSRVSDRIDELKPIASGVRLVLIGLVAALWPRLVQITHRHGRIDEGRRDTLLAKRWRVVSWLLVIELVLGQDLIGRFFAVTTRSIV